MSTQTEPFLQAHSQNSNEKIQKIIHELEFFCSMPNFIEIYDDPDLGIGTSRNYTIEPQELIPRIESYFAEIFPHLHMVNFKIKYNSDTKMYEYKLILDIFNMRNLDPSNKKDIIILPALNTIVSAKSAKILAELTLETVKNYLLNSILVLFKSLNDKVINATNTESFDSMFSQLFGKQQT